MYSRVMAVLSALALSAAAIAVITVGSAAPAGAATAGTVQSLASVQAATCYWHIFGDWSNCDGVDPDALGSSCGGDARTVATVRMRNLQTGAESGPYLDLRYSSNCRTVWARLRGAWGQSQGDFGCWVRIHRNSDGEEQLKVPPYGAVNATVWTNVLYDADVTSFAYAACENGIGQRYEGLTRNW